MHEEQAEEMPHSHCINAEANQSKELAPLRKSTSPLPKKEQAASSASLNAVKSSVSEASYPALASAVSRSGAQRRNSSALLITLTELNAIAAPATTGFNNPSAANGMPIRL